MTKWGRPPSLNIRSLGHLFVIRHSNFLIQDPAAGHGPLRLEVGTFRLSSNHLWLHPILFFL
jgi:hypothetical protein